MAANPSSAPSALTTLLVSRFIPSRPARSAEPRLAAPYQSRDRSPGECGCTRSENVSKPSLPLERRSGRAADEAQQPGEALVAEVLHVARVGVERLADVGVVHRRADADPRVEPAAGQDVDGGEVLGEPQGVLPAERDHRGAQLDAPGALRRRGQHRDRRRDAVLQVPVAQPGAVEPQLLTQLDHPQRRLVAGPRIGSVEQPDREEAELAQRTIVAHAGSVSRAVNPRARPGSAALHSVVLSSRRTSGTTSSANRVSTSCCCG